MRACAFCNIGERGVVMESEFSIAFYDQYPVTEGHVLIVPKKHSADYFELSPVEKKDLWALVDAVKHTLEKKYSPDGFNVGINVGAAAGQTIFHCHIHIIPRYKGDMEFPEGGVRGVIPGKQKYGK